jgi:hypothetical protein
LQVFRVNQTNGAMILPTTRPLLRLPTDIPDKQGKTFSFAPADLTSETTDCSFEIPDYCGSGETQQNNLNVLIGTYPALDVPPA